MDSKELATVYFKDAKICYKCKHHTGTGHWSQCNHPNNSYNAVDVVTGADVKRYQNCNHCRSPSLDNCGLQGRWFEPKPIVVSGHTKPDIMDTL